MKENLIKGKLKDFIKTYESCYSSTWLGLKYTINKLTSLVIQKQTKYNVKTLEE